MYTLYYISESLQISTLEVETLDQEIIIPENLHFIALRKGINFINEPHSCIDFTDLERLAIAQRLDDLNLFQNHPFRLKNSKFSPLCQIDPKPKLNFELVFSNESDEQPPVIIEDGNGNFIYSFPESGFVDLDFLDYYKYTLSAFSSNLHVQKKLELFINGAWILIYDNREFVNYSIAFTESIYPENATKIRLTIALTQPV